MMVQQNKELFLLQSELIDMKVNMAVNSSIGQVIEQIRQLKTDMHAQIRDLRDEVQSFKSEMHEFKHEIRAEIREEISELRHEMRDEFSSLKTRMTAVETKLGMVSEPRKEIRNRFIDYCFKGGWLLLAATVSYFVLQFQLLIK